MSAKSGVQKQCFIESDLMDNPHDTVSMDMHCAIRDCYPAGSTLSSLAKCLLSKGKGTPPAPNSHEYFVPKVSLFLKPVGYSNGYDP